ncbi:MAG: gephyrin-like molybdotransferase Glp [Chloroflexota bacterium]
MPDLLSVSTALERLLAAFEPVENERVSLAASHGRVLAEAIHATSDSPPFANASMDGFALQAGDTAAATPETPIRLRVMADIPAGYTSQVSLQPGQAARIMTGAPLPEGADAVIPVEETDAANRDAGLPPPPHIHVYRAVQAGGYIRPRGQDFRNGETLLMPGRRLRPQEVGLLASLGIAKVPVYRRPRVAILSSGDELLPVDEPLRPGTIHESNSYMLAGQIQSCGAEAIPLGIVADRPEAIQAALDRAVADGADAIISSAGVSVGAFDFVRQVVETHGRLDFWRVNMRPGKPLVCGAYCGLPFVGLPGNPVSTFIGFEVFVRPGLLKLAGLKYWQPVHFLAELAEPIESDGRESYLRAYVARKGDRWLASLAGHQGSGNLRGLTQANALLIIPSEVKSLPTGARIAARWLGDLANTEEGPIIHT